MFLMDGGMSKRVIKSTLRLRVSVYNAYKNLAELLGSQS